MPFLTNLFSARRLTCSAIAVGGCLVGGMAPRAHAVTTNFAQFFERNGGNDFSYTSNSTTATFSASSPVTLNYQNIPNLPADLQADQSATLSFSATTSRKAFDLGDGDFSQKFESATLLISRNGPAAEGDNPRTVLLSVTFTNFTFTGSSGPTGGAGGFNASSNASTTTVNFSSNFLDFSATNVRNLALSFSSISPGLSLNSSGFFNDFATAGTGTFASDPLPSVVPEGDSRPALGFLFGVVGLWELVRRFRGGWTRAGRDEMNVS